mgnify:CR=1 FL=1
MSRRRGAAPAPAPQGNRIRTEAGKWIEAKLNG